MMMAEMDNPCLPPFCRATSGQCCFPFATINGISCPESC